MSTRTRRRIIGKLVICVLLATPLALALATPAEAGKHRGRCISAVVDQPVLMPGGVEHPAGKLTLCETHHLSPVSGLHQAFVDGQSVAIMYSRRGFSEGTYDHRPFMMFVRDGRGRLHLYGFATPAGKRMATYELGSGPAPAPAVASNAPAGAATSPIATNLDPPVEPRNDSVLLATGMTVGK